jgi:hypothetical protein
MHSTWKLWHYITKNVSLHIERLKEAELVLLLVVLGELRQLEDILQGGGQFSVIFVP